MDVLLILFGFFCLLVYMVTRLSWLLHDFCKSALVNKFTKQTLTQLNKNSKYVSDIVLQYNGHIILRLFGSKIFNSNVCPSSWMSSDQLGTVFI